MFTGLFRDKTIVRALSARTPEQSLQRIMQSKRLAPYRVVRHRMIGFFVVDYMFPERALIVELADPRAVGTEQDKTRVRSLEESGYRLLRLSRAEVVQRPGRVRLLILNALQK